MASTVNPDEEFFLSPTPQEGQTAPPQMAKWLNKNIALGFEMDIDIYLSYIQFVYDDGIPVDHTKLAIKFATCHIFWDTMAEWGVSAGNVTPEMFRVSADRMLQATMTYISRAGGDPETVVPALIMRLLASNISFRDGTVITCTALDRAVYRDMLQQEMPPPAPQPEPEKEGFAS